MQRQTNFFFDVVFLRSKITEEKKKLITVNINKLNFQEVFKSLILFKNKNWYSFETSSTATISNIFNLLIANPNQRIANGEIDKQQISIEKKFRLYLDE